MSLMTHPSVAPSISHFRKSCVTLPIPDFVEKSGIMNGQDPTSMEALYQRPGFIIRRAHQIVLALFDEEAADLGLTTTQYSVLHTLRARPGINQMGLCELIGIDRSTATMVLRLLEKNGLVERKQSEKDRRRNTLMLTSAGEDLLVRAAPLSNAISTRMREVLNDEELSQLSHLLLQFVQSFNHRVRNPLLPDTATAAAPTPTHASSS